MIEEAEQSNARERWWRRSLERLAIPNSVPSDASAGGRAELQAAHAQIESLLVARDEDVMARWMDVRYDLPLEWQASQWIGKFRIWSTVKRARDTYDTGTWFGDPTLEASNPGKCDNASLDINPGAARSHRGSGSSIRVGSGPYGRRGAPSETASASFDAVTRAFDPTVGTSTGDMWLFDNGFSDDFNPVYLEPGRSTSIPLTITPTAGPGTHVSGCINLDDAFQFDDVSPVTVFQSGDELASTPFSYTVM